MKKILPLLIALTAFPVFAQSITNVTVTVVTPPAVVTHKIVIANAIAQLDSQAPKGKKAFVTGGFVAADGTLTLTVTYR